MQRHFVGAAEKKKSEIGGEHATFMMEAFNGHKGRTTQNVVQIPGYMDIEESDTGQGNGRRTTSIFGLELSLARAESRRNKKGRKHEGEKGREGQKDYLSRGMGTSTKRDGKGGGIRAVVLIEGQMAREQRSPSVNGRERSRKKNWGKIRRSPCQARVDNTIAMLVKKAMH